MFVMFFVSIHFSGVLIYFIIVFINQGFGIELLVARLCFT